MGQPVCYQPTVVGECRGAFRRWTFDQRTRSCEEFVYGGCNGNDNRFNTPEACEEMCNLLVESQGEFPMLCFTCALRIYMLLQLLLWVLPEAYWVPPNPLTVGGWIPYPLMLVGWNEPIIWTFLPKTGFQDISMISFDAQNAYCVKTSSLRCHSMVPTLYPYVIMAWTLMEISRHWALLGGMFNDSIRLCPQLVKSSENLW